MNDRFTVWQGVSEQRFLVADDDFGYDAMLEISGDFVGEEGRKYADAVAAALNAAQIPVRREQNSGASPTLQGEQG